MACKSSEWLHSKERYCFKIQLIWGRTPPQAPACSASLLLIPGSQALLREGFSEQPGGEALQNRRRAHRTAQAGWTHRDHPVQLLGAEHSPGALQGELEASLRHMGTAQEASVLRLREVPGTNLDFSSSL